MRRIRVSEGVAVTDVALDHPGMTEGWWALETDAAGTRRWTSGDAALPIGPGGTRVVDITAGPPDRWPAMSPRRAGRRGRRRWRRRTGLMGGHRG